MTVTNDIVDARPIIQASEASPWSVADSYAAKVRAALESELEQRGIKAGLWSSPPGSHPATVRLDAWMPQEAEVSKAAGKTSRRLSMTYTFHVHPYRRRVNVVDIAMERRGVGKTYQGMLQFSIEEAVTWLRYGLELGPQPRVDEHFQHTLWSTLAMPFVSPRYNPIDERYRNTLPPTPATMMAVGGAVLLMGTLITPLLGLIGAGLLIAAYIVVRRRPRVVTCVDKPLMEPRRPKVVDAWNTTIPKLGGDIEDVRRRLFEVVSATPVDRMTTSWETYAYFGPDGYVERQQMVVTLSQALVYVHVYGFENELFVGWDANLNLVRWIESAPVSNKVVDGVSHEFRTVVVGQHQPNEYDLIDLNMLTEVVHRRLRDELRKIMAEKKIDEEIDFTIIRGERQGLTGEQKPKENSLQERTRRFLRVNP